MPKYIRQSLDYFIEFGYEPDREEDLESCKFLERFMADLTTATKLAIAANNITSAEYFLLMLSQELDNPDLANKVNERFDLIKKCLESSNKILMEIHNESVFHRSSVF